MVIQVHVFGDDEHSLQKTTVLTVLDECVKGNLYLSICKHLGELEFESRKDAAQIFGALLRLKNEEGASPMAEYVEENSTILKMLFRG